MQPVVLLKRAPSRSLLKDSVLHFGHRELTSIGLGLLVTAALFGASRQYATALFLVWLIAVCLYYARRSTESGLCILAFALPFEQVFYIYGVARYNSLSYLALGLLGLWYINQPRFHRALESQEWLFSALLVWCLLTSFWAAELIGSIQGFVKLAGGFACLLLYSRGLVDRLSMRRALWFYVLGTVALGTYAAFYYQTAAFIIEEDDYEESFSYLGSGTDLSSPELARVTSIGFLATLLLRETEKDSNRRLLALGVALLLGIYTLLTTNRSASFGLGGVMLIWALLDGRTLTKAGRLIGALTLCGTVIMAGFAINEGALRFRFIDEVRQENPERVLTGRLGIWDSAIESFKSHPLEGVGLGQFAYEFASRTGQTRGAHSSYVEMLIETGLIGFSVFIVLLVVLGYKAWHTGTWRPVTVAWWSLFLLIIATQSIHRGKEFWMVMGITCALARLERVQAYALTRHRRKIR